MPYNSEAFGIIIGRERARLGLTQERLSALAEISRSHLAALECGSKIPRVDTLYKIAEALSIKPSTLIMMME